ncbi:Fe-S cluster biogenesis protein NfuA [Mesoflavibacter sabulilitoris]|uniref:NifU family protein n=1 Tax=Mesoflavibacter zeaxanthinifaciens subsp. sabulilitoris TaxID=1520893 RepID=A0A2T1NLS9_9FLAO|nr:NifU family protein [Mesoflavibacter zeaxanthinifaciens]MBB3124445.1 Fe-S cluster biogenesis protein NfuA [Mesoflavibacter zeaxanthinifaciens subsp. sabulilitoris]MCP4053894.1 NifU family protein [Mesoflavibacter sp.]PSG93816.1 NifU family protein [Mesoflavibacter zeaxanthinifaciens subsp. sabulilitoris]
MSTYKISIQNTSNPTILKFDVNQFITKHQNYEYNNIDEAKDSPLAQQLFYLPFVKKVYISSNFIAIERYNIVEWDDVKDEVAKQIENYLNNDGVIVTETATTQKVPVTVYTESTPNPAALKFVANKKLVTATYDYDSIEKAKTSPLATALFHFPFVKSVFFDENYISITKYDIAEWNDITVELRDFIKKYIEEGKNIIDPNAPEVIEKSTEKVEQHFENLDTTSQEIINILEEYVKPAVASDGGNIQFESYDEPSKSVKVILQGACSGCPSSTFTLKNGIENMLKEMLPGRVNTVVAING